LWASSAKFLNIMGGQFEPGFLCPVGDDEVHGCGGEPSRLRQSMFSSLREETRD
jgi:hypothetical protein